MIKPENASLTQFFAFDNLIATDPELANAGRQFVGNRSQIAAWSVVCGIVEGTVPSSEEAAQNGAAAEVLRRQAIEVELLTAYPGLLDHIAELEIPGPQQAHITTSDQLLPHYASL